MFSLKQLNKDSYPIAIIRDDSKQVQDVVYFTEKSRKFNTQEVPFEKQISKYIISDTNQTYRLSREYTFEMTPNISESPTSMPRFINFYLATSNSGKSYQISMLCKKYLEMFPKNSIIYASANPLGNDVNYESIKHKIHELDIMALESVIDFSEETLRNSLLIFDDCDSAMSTTLKDIDPRLTEEAVNELSVTERNKALKMLKTKSEEASEWVNKSIISFCQNGRKMNQSLCIVGHKPFNGKFENLICNESTGIVLFPSAIRKNVLEKFMIEKLSIDKGDANNLLFKSQWYRYDWLFLSHRTATQFALSPDFLKILHN